MKIPLFDLDGTLIKSKHKFRLNRFTYAIEKVFGIKVELSSLTTDDMIDSQILIELLSLNGISKEKSQEKLPEMFLIMEEFLVKYENEIKYEALPGAYELLEELCEKNIPVAVLTGNVECFGWKKLEKINLKKFITTGSFGNMALKRSDLIGIVLEKLQLECDEQIQKSSLVIVGDTPLDIKCAKEGNIYSIGVATGKYSKKELKEEGADLVFDSLLQKKEIIDYLIK